MSVLRIAVYGRHSTDKQNPASSADQAASCDPLVAALGGTVVGTYLDEEISGYQRNRPGLLAMLAAIRRGEIDAVVSEAFDRLARDPEDMPWIGKKLKFDRVRLWTLSEGEIDDVKLAIAIMMGAMFLSNLQAKTLRGMEAKVLTGRHAGGRAYGYRSVHAMDPDGNPIRGILEIHDEEAVVRRIFDEFASGKSAIQIAKGLNGDGIKGPRGNQWNASTIRGDPKKAVGILNNSLYHGELIWKRREWRKDPDLDARPRRYRMRDENEWKTVAAPGLRIVSNLQWQAVREQILKRARKADAPALVHSPRRRHFLSGSIKCGACGANYTISGKDYYRCAGVKERGTCSNTISVRKGLLENAVLASLQSSLLTPSLARHFVSEFMRQARVEGAKAAKLESTSAQRLVELDRQIETLARNMTLGAASPTLLRFLNDLEAEKASLRTAPRPQLRQPNMPSATEFLEFFLTKLSHLRHLLHNEQYATQAAEALSDLVYSVTILPGERPAIEIAAEIGRLAEFATENENSPRLTLGGCSLSVVAGAGFEPATFRL